MAPVIDPVSADTFTSFGDLLKYLRRRERLTQLELSIKVGYSEAQISRLEKNQRLPDPTGIKALFIPALHLEDDPQLASRLLELAQTARQFDAPSPGIAPYKGLLYFDEQDAELFFGREALTEVLVKHVIDLTADASNRFLAVVGASGSGKSSLVRAGLAVTLGRAGWKVLVFTPTIHPLQMLEARLNTATREGAERILILVDQFEEVFTLCHDEIDRIAFIEKLLSCAREMSRKFSVVIALRADFYPHCSQYPLLRQAVAAEQEYIGQMTLKELRQAIEEPARRNGWEFEPGLVDVMLQDLSTHGSREPEPGALPLLSHALLTTWDHRRGRTLTLDGYHASGGVRGAIAETAESVFTDRLNQQQQEIARDVFLRLTELGEGTEDTRRRAALNELGRQFEETAQFREVLNTLAEARLITLNEDSAEVSHEALIREWQRLHKWLTQDRESLLLHRHLTEAAQEWERRGRDTAELYRGARLAQAKEWSSANTVRLNQAENDFLAASVDREQHEALEREAQRQRELEIAQSLAEAERKRSEEHRQAAQRLQRRAWQLAGALALALVLATIAILFARQANQNYITSQQQTRLATSRELSAAALNNLDVDQERSMLLAMQAVKTADIPEAENALHQAVLSSRLRDTLAGHMGPIYGIAFTPGTAQRSARLATASQDGTLKIWEVDESRINIKETPLVTITNPIDFVVAATGSGFNLAFSPDGNQLAAIGSDHTAKIWDVASGKLRQTLSGHKGNIMGLAYSPIEELVVTSSEDGSARVWDALTGQVLQTLCETAINVTVMAFDSDGKHLACGKSNGTVLVWERNDESTTPVSSEPYVQSFEIDSQLPEVWSIAFSPDGKKLAIGLTDINVYDIASADAISPARLVLNIQAHQNIVNGLFFSPDGKNLVSGSGDGTTKVWDAETGQLRFTLNGNAGPIFSIAQSNSGELLFTAQYNGQVKVWDISVKGNQEWLSIPDMTIAFETRSANRLVIVDSESGQSHFRVLVISPEGTREIYNIPVTHNADLNFDTDQELSQLVFIFFNSYIVHVWDLATGREVRTFSIQKTPTTAGHTTNDNFDIMISPDGSRLATGGSDGSVFLWDVETGKLLYEMPGQRAIFGGWDSIVFSLDGKMLATASYDGSVCIWDVNSGKLLHSLPGLMGPFTNASFSPDGKRLLATAEGLKVNLWDVQTGQLILALSIPTLVDSLEISPDGKYLATATLDGIVRLWDATTGRELLNLPGFYAKFTQDGKHLLASKDNNLFGYMLDINELMELARTRLTRSWTQEECSKFLHTEVCPPTP